jgi:hypothetical protein
MGLFLFLGGIDKPVSLFDCVFKSLSVKNSFRVG